ncbi:isocitrate--homoisocitrate dehydrogenase [Pyrococcus horikoshii]|uniref:Isocitrate/homoisocitrate dehydrogenase n=2 Tax=Pyrococcus horikoshii TaxID=53953 RepID=HICDH_PYRHO
MYKVAVIKGDGIGPEVIDAAIRVVKSVTDKIKFYEFEGGLSVFKKYGVPIREEDLEEIRKMDAILFGATTTPFDVPRYKSLIITLRKELDLYANLRIIPNFKLRKEIIIVRENSEGLYSGEGAYDSNKVVDFRIITRKGAERIAKFAVKLAKDRSTFLTFVHKANILESDRFFRKIVLDIARKEDVKVREEIVDSFTIKLVKDPWNLGIILSENMFGDILSDLATIHAGSIGIVPSGNYGEDIALFEPIHGSAPDIAGKGIANPIGAILSAAMMLDYLGLDGSIIWKAVGRYVRRGNLTPDMEGRATTLEVTNGIISEIYRLDEYEIDEVWRDEVRLGRILLEIS